MRTPWIRSKRSRSTFFQECDELLGDLEAKSAGDRVRQADDETINAVFRAVHSVKGGAGAFGLDALVRFAHVFETLMDELRSGRKVCDDVTVRPCCAPPTCWPTTLRPPRPGPSPRSTRPAPPAWSPRLEVLTHGEARPAAEAPVEEDPKPR
jgi:two-component system chemotaxis sensor kinase CheA